MVTPILMKGCWCPWEHQNIGSSLVFKIILSTDVAEYLFIQNLAQILRFANLKLEHFIPKNMVADLYSNATLMPFEAIIDHPQI